MKPITSHLFSIGSLRSIAAVELCLGLLYLATASATAQTFSIVHSFGVLTNVGGRSVHQSLVQGPDGTFYGTASDGEGNVQGTVFRVNRDGTGFRALKWFTNSLEGDIPLGGLVLSGTTLYGTTYQGGHTSQYYGFGTVFTVNTDGSGYTVLKYFDGSDGLHPSASLVLSGGTLYGTTIYGGSQNLGTLFKVNTDGSGYAVLKHFGGTDGSEPVAGLALDGNTLYGTASHGGVTNQSSLLGYGTVFKVNTDGSGYSVLKYFGGSEGYGPVGRLVLSGSTLYGTATSGGVTNQYNLVGFGTVFKVNTDGSGFAVLKYFNSSDGAASYGDLVLFGGTLYGTTVEGGPRIPSYYDGCGTVFKVNTDGTGYGVLRYFGGSDGANPSAGLVLSDNALYGTTQVGGSCKGGTLFKVNTDGSDFSVLENLGCASDGFSPSAGLVVSGGTLYGATPFGGSAYCGALFKVNSDGSAYEVLNNFINDRATPRGDLVLSDNTLYGAAFDNVFRVNADGSGYAVLKHLSGSDGIDLGAGLTLSGDTLYGTAAQGGLTNFNHPSGFGTVFKVKTDGSGFAVLKRFTGTDGTCPRAVLVLSDGILYGTTYYGGSSDSGTVFKLNTDGSGYAVLKHFNFSDGFAPNAGLLLSGGRLYGTTHTGGSQNCGTVFGLDTDGSGFAVLKHFQRSDGAGPSAALVFVGNMLWGTTYSGGTSDSGTIFKLNTDGSGYAVLKHFNGSDGANPSAGLVFSGGRLYGTAVAGGFLDEGVVFGFSYPPMIRRPPAGQWVESGSAARFSVRADGFPPLTYQWYFNGTPLTDCTNLSLALAGVPFASSGSYLVVVSNIFGAVTSSPAMLGVIPPVPRRTVSAINLSGDLGSVLHVSYADTPGPGALWHDLDTVTLSGTPQLYLDLSEPLPPYRFYRAWQSNVPIVPPMLQLSLATEIQLTGAIGSQVRIDYINQFGPTDPWATLDTVTLTNTTQLYFDLTIFHQPARLYRLVPLP